MLLIKNEVIKIQYLIKLISQQRQSCCLTESGHRFNPWQVRNSEIISLSLGLELEGMMKQNLTLVSIPNIWLSPKSLCSAYEVKALVLLILIHPSDGDV